MRRERQQLDDLLASLSPLASAWRDAHSDAVIRVIGLIPQKRSYDRSDLEALLAADFDAAMTAIRLVLELSKDEFTVAMRATLPAGTGVKRFREDQGTFVEALYKLGVLEQLATLVNSPVTWRTILVERLKAGRGSAIKWTGSGARPRGFCRADRPRGVRREELQRSHAVRRGARHEHGEGRLRDPIEERRENSHRDEGVWRNGEQAD